MIMIIMIIIIIITITIIIIIIIMKHLQSANLQHNETRPRRAVQKAAKQ